MKRKLFILLSISILIINSIFALGSDQTLPGMSVFVQPMIGTGGIPMNPSRIKGGFSPYTSINGNYVNSDWGNLTGKAPFMPNVEVKPPSLWPPKPAEYGPDNAVDGRYSTREILCIGGARNIQNIKKDSVIKLAVTATCNNGFFFVSQSNPYYRRPFELALVPRMSKYELYNDGSNRRPDYILRFVSEHYGKPRVIRDNSQTVDLTYTKTADGNVATYDMWFDIVLVLPGEIKAGDLVDNKYPLKVTDDYSALVTFTVQLLVDDKPVGVPSVLTVPFTGFYDRIASGPTDSTVSMFIRPSALAGSLDMTKYGEAQEIADIEILGVKNLGTADEAEGLLGSGFIGAIFDVIVNALFERAPEHFIGIFLSSSENPQVKGKEFMMVRDNLSADVDSELTEYNHIKFQVLLQDKSDPSKKVYYKGTDFVKTLPNESNFSDYKFLIVPKGVPNRATNSKMNNNKSYTYGGTASVILEDKSTVLMEAGRYTGNVYVHVITFS